MDRQRGFSLLELAVVAVALSVLLAVLLGRLAYYQEVAERARFESTLQVFKTALQIRLAELMLERRDGEARMLEAENPVRWLAEKPAGYAGDYPSSPEPGHWYFDAGVRELVYVPATGSRLAVEPRDGVKQLRFRVHVVYQTVAVAGGRIQAVAGVIFAPTAPFSWR